MEQLFALILREQSAAPAPLLPPEPSARRAARHSSFEAWLRELERYLPSPSDPELDDYYRYALMGVVVGFGDRNLSPYLAEHTAILPPLLEDIRTVFDQVKARQGPYSQEEFIFRAYDYGIHKAYYLDWDLYLSHDMY